MAIIGRLLAFVLEPFVKPSSVVLKRDWNGTTAAIKYYKPKLFVRILYSVFRLNQHSPYEYLAGIKRARALRKVANHVTFLKRGVHAFTDPITAELNIVEEERKWIPILVTEWVEGPPVDRKEAKDFLDSIASALRWAGLPAWPVTNPLAYKDVRRKPNGSLICLDLESVLPNIFVDIEEYRMRIEAKPSAKPWSIDWVNFGRLEKALERAKLIGYVQYENFAYWSKVLEKLSIEGGFV